VKPFRTDRDNPAADDRLSEHAGAIGVDSISKEHPKEVEFHPPAAAKSL